MRYAIIAVNRFSLEQGISVPNCCDIIEAAEKVFKAGELDYNEENSKTERQYEKAVLQLKNLATNLGFDGVAYPGLWPCLIKNGNHVQIPSVSS